VIGYAHDVPEYRRQLVAEMDADITVLRAGGEVDSKSS
jgi:hypothetical protein